MDDDTLLQQFTDIHDAVSTNIQMTKDLKDDVKGIKTDMRDMKKEHDNDIKMLDTRVTVLETDKTVENEKQNWIKQHPIQAGVGAGGITTIIMAGIAIITKILEVW